MLVKLHDQHGKNALYIKPKSANELKFGVVHFAGNVMYSSAGFLDKNRDTFSFDLLSVIGNTKENKYMTELFFDELAMTADTRKRNPTLGAQFKSSLNLLMKVRFTPSSITPTPTPATKCLMSVCMPHLLFLKCMFVGMSHVLLQTLGECNPFFVRCVKPNEFKVCVVYLLIAAHDNIIRILFP